MGDKLRQPHWLQSEVVASVTQLRVSNALVFELIDGRL